MYIPNRYLILDQTVLASALKGFHPEWGYWKDVIINIGGFIPAGFFFYAYLCSRQLRWPRLTAIVAGGAVSLTIELVQTYLPTRDSDLTDVITNILGTCIGLMLYQGRLNLIPGLEPERRVAVGSRSEIPSPHVF